MQGRLRLTALAFGLALAGSARADLTRALKEPNLEKRSQLALDNATAAYKAAREAYEKGENEQVARWLAEIQESVELAIHVPHADRQGSADAARSGSRRRRSKRAN